MSVARHARAISGSGFGQLFLLGWSRGGQIGYAALDGETQLPPGQRNVRGFTGLSNGRASARARRYSCFSR